MLVEKVKKVFNKFIRAAGCKNLQRASCKSRFPRNGTSGSHKKANKEIPSKQTQDQLRFDVQLSLKGVPSLELRYFGHLCTGINLNLISPRSGPAVSPQIRATRFA